MPPSASADAESLFRTKTVPEIRNVETATRSQIQQKQEELRQLVGTRYRDLIDSADSIVLMQKSSQSISANVSSISATIRSLSFSSSSSETPKLIHPDPARTRIYGIACRVKYLVDSPENIWGCLDESMFVESAARYVRAKHVHHTLTSTSTSTSSSSDDLSVLANFPLLHHQWQIVESFKVQISQRSRERLLERELPISAYADALAGVAVIDEIHPNQVLSLFLETRKSWISQKLLGIFDDNGGNASCDVVVSVFCEVLRIIQISIGQVGELFLHVLTDMPLFYKVVLSSPPAAQLFGGIPNPDEEVRLWNNFREKLESLMVMLDKGYVARTCSAWLRECGQMLVKKINGRYLIDAIYSGEELALAEKSIRETVESKKVLEGSLDWLRNVIGSEIELPWSRIRELVLEDDSDLWDEIFEDAFVGRMKVIVETGFEDLTGVVNVADTIRAIGEISGGHGQIDFQGYLNRPSTGGGVWFIDSCVKKAGVFSGFKAPVEENDFQSCLNAYFGAEVSRIRDAVDSRCQSVLQDVLSFLESPKAALRLKDLAPYVQNKCYESMSTILTQLKRELDNLYAAMENANKEGQPVPPAITVERSLFIGRLLFAFRNHSKHIPVILGSPRFWVNESVSVVFDKLPFLLRPSRAAADSPVPDSPGRQLPVGSKRQISSAAAALRGAIETASPKLEEFSRTTRDLCIRAHSLWILWLSDELSVILSRDLGQDDALSSTTPLRGWEETVVKQEQSDEGQSEMKISLPSLPSLYIISFLFRACEEVHRIGGHVLDKMILQKFALRLLEKEFSDSQKPKYPFRRKQDQGQKKSVIRERVDGLVNRLSQRLDPIDWLTYEPYLWENERQSYLRHAVLFGFYVQLNRMYTDTVQKLPTNSESNIMRCSTVPRFKYLPISAPALSSRGTTKTSITAPSDDISSRTSWKAYTNGDLSGKMDLDDNSSFGVAAPLLKSFMQVGSRFGESTFKLGSILTDGQVGIFKDRSAAAMSTFGDILPAQAAGLLSSFTASRSDS
ncbi:hypothetical protein ACJW30_08G153500 [Castanea mollissima]